MTETIGILLTLGVFFFAVCYFVYMRYCRDNSASSTSIVNIQESPENPFDDLRNLVFSTTPEHLGLSFPPDKTVVYGIIMDIGLGINGTVATTVCYQTGDASLYLSSGGGVIGGGYRQNVNNAARQFVSLAQAYLDKAIKTEAAALPTTN